MLSRVENKVMTAILSLCGSKEQALINPCDLKRVLLGSGITDITLEQTVNNLSTDGYFDLVYTERKGEKVYCITLTEQGKGYHREKKMIKRNLLVKLLTTVVFAVISFIIGLILKAVF